jgi:hypothetical protein
MRKKDKRIQLLIMKNKTLSCHKLSRERVSCGIAWSNLIEDGGKNE